MLIFISGGVRSGKSTFAEKLAIDLSINRKVYLATAMVYDNEMRKRVDKHQVDRKNDNWVTYEKYIDIGDIKDLNKDDVLLIDCLTNLTANELFENNLGKKEVVEKILNGILNINDRVKDLIIVSNDLFSGLDNYLDDTNKFVETLGKLHCKLTSYVDEAYELNFSIVSKRK